ncbi:MAG: alpha-L-fucosidase [Candidatus Cyclobacteriaceae bacterium M3_2C_046]
MKKYIVAICLFQLVFSLKAQDVYQQRQQRTQWFQDARFGMFIHWGIYAIPARGEWVRQNEKLSVEDYQPYFKAFDPEQYNPKEWARIAQRAGMKYGVMTAKHHDGFCLFDSEYTDYKATNTPAGRDLIREYVDAFREEGLKVGFYYSLLDWHHPDYLVEGECVVHPMTGKDGYSNEGRDFSKYITYMHSQVRELMTNYGKIDILWLDFSCGEMTGERWEATKLVKMVRQLQPDIIIDNRLGGNMELEQPEPYAGDFEGPEQVIPQNGIFDELNRPIPWEACITLNNDWGYSTNNDYKSSRDIIHALVNVVSKGGNLLLNVGPDAKGNIPDQSVRILDQVGDWMKLNGESIYGCGPAPYPKPEWGRFTMKDNKLYAHITGSNIGQFLMAGMKGQLNQGWLLNDGREVFIGPYWHGKRSYIQEDDVFFNLGNPPQHTFIPPDPVNTVVKFELSHMVEK